MAWCAWSSKSLIFKLKTTGFQLPNWGPRKKPGFGTFRVTPRRLQNGLVRLELKICIFDTENDRFSTAKV